MRSWLDSHRLEVVWATFAAVNLVVLLQIGNWETVLFHVVWVSVTIFYGFRVWQLGPRRAVLGGVGVVAAVTMSAVIIGGPYASEELSEVPLMAAMFFAMVWHAERGHTAVDRLQRSAERERDFVRDASHELRTPIAISRALTQLMMQADEHHDPREEVAELDGELRRLERLADRLLLLATAEQDGGLALEVVELEDVVVSAARRWSVTAARNWRVDAQTEASISADRGRLDTVLDALVENAIAATVDGDTIEFRARDDGRAAVIEVADTGRGIDPGLLPHVFERFTSSNEGGPRGTGLGLPIVAAIVAAHDGSVAIRSEPGVETAVTMTFPRRLGHPAPTRAAARLSTAH